jgi:hypothetical protein
MPCTPQKGEILRKIYSFGDMTMTGTEGLHLLTRAAVRPVRVKLTINRTFRLSASFTAV